MDSTFNGKPTTTNMTIKTAAKGRTCPTMARVDLPTIATKVMATIPKMMAVIKVSTW